MKKLLQATALALVFTLSAYSSTPVEIGMTEAMLLEIKGKPQWNAASGIRVTYGWPDMQVSLTNGNVDEIRFRDLKKEKENAAHHVAKKNAADRAAKKKKAEMAALADAAREVTPIGPVEDYVVEVVQVVPGKGAMVDILQLSSGGVRADSMQSIGGGGGSSKGWVGYIRTGKVAYLQGLNGCVDGDRFSVTAAPTGSCVQNNSTFARFIVYSSQKF